MTTPASQPVDWIGLAREYQKQIADLIHHDSAGRDLSGDEFYAEALRRALGHRPANDPATPHVGRDTIGHRFGLTTTADAEFLRNAHTVMDRLSADAARKQADAARKEARRVLLEAAADCADLIRARCNDRSVPSRYRREGAAWAADLIDPRVRKDQYGNVVAADPAQATGAAS